MRVGGGVGAEGEGEGFIRALERTRLKVSSSSSSSIRNFIRAHRTFPSDPPTNETADDYNKMIIIKYGQANGNKHGS